MSEVREGYKMTELGEIPSDWEVNYLKDICEFMNGKAHEDIVDENGEYILVNSKFVSTEGRVFKKVTENISPLLKHDIAIVMSDIPKGRAFAKCFLVEENNKYTLNQRIGLIRTNSLVPKYLFYQLNRNSYFLKFDDGVSQTNIRKPDLLQCPVLIPTYREQQKIVSILSTVDEQIDETEQLIVKTKKLKKGLMQQLLTKGIGHTEFKQTELGEIPIDWGVERLEDVSIGKGDYGIGAKAVKFNGTKPRYLRITDFNEDGKLLNNDVKTFEGEDYSQYQLNVGDIVFARTGNSTGKSYLYKEKDGELVYAGFLIKFKINPNMANELFVFYNTKNLRYKNWVEKMSQRSGQPGINSKEYGEYLIPLPSLEEQQKIASILSTVDEQIEAYEEEKTKYEELKKGLMQQLLTGQIRVKI